MQAGLKELLKQAEEYLHANRPEATLQLCQEILQEHPRCLRACRLVGEALWAKGHGVAAARVFQAILSVDPEDLVARYGLAMALEDQDPKEALRQMEIAFALSPANEEIRRNLQRFYKARGGQGTGDLTARLKLSQEALARLYARGGLWARAAVEVKRLLKAQPDRIDLRLLLAEALWYTGEHAQAAALCQEVLSIWPYCRKADLILGRIWQDAGKNEAAQALLRKVEELEPEGRENTNSPVSGFAASVRLPQSPGLKGQ